MTTGHQLTEAEFDRLTQDIIEKTIAERGTRKAQTANARLLRCFVDHHREHPLQACGATSLWAAIKGIEKKEVDSIDPDQANRIRKEICLLNKRLATYFGGPGRHYSIRLTIDGRVLRTLDNHSDAAIPPIPHKNRSALGLLCIRSDWFNGELIAGVHQRAAALGHRLSLAFSETDILREAQQLAYLRSHCAGVLIVSQLDEFAQTAPDLTSHLLALKQGHFPHVFVDHRVPDCGEQLVASDNEQGGATAAEGLISELGCQELHILKEPGSQAARERANGARRYAGQHLGADRIFEITASEPGESGGGKFMDHLFKRLVALPKRKRPLIGVFATDDRLAEGVRSFLNVFEGRQLQRTVAVIGFGGRDYAFSLPPRVSMQEDFFRIGSEAVDVLVELIRLKRYGKIPKVNLSKRVPVSLGMPLADDSRLLAQTAYPKPPRRPPLRPPIAAPAGISSSGKSFGNSGDVPPQEVRRKVTDSKKRV